MKKEIADKWIEALRSGKYEQTQSHLRIEDGYCCLGVLCDISDQADWDNELDCYSYSGHTGVLPEDVQAWAGMKSDSGERTGRKQTLVGRNDAKASFETIAKIIEKEWETL